MIGLGISVIMLIIRIPVVRIALPADIDSISDKDKAFLAMMIPRGLAAAVLATMISQSELIGSEGVSNIVFSVIFFSIIFTSILVPFLEKSKRFRDFYIKLIKFPSFRRKNKIDDNTEIHSIDANSSTKDQDDSPQILI